jgi:Protein of unknown function (DUF2889)
VSAPPPPVDLELPVDALQRTKAVGLWYEDETLRVRAHLRDAYTEPDGSQLVLHEYRLDLWVELATMVVTAVAVEPIHLPYGECFDAAPEAQRLVGLRLERGFTGEARRRLGGELGCTHLNSLMATWRSPGCSTATCASASRRAAARGCP